IVRQLEAHRRVRTGVGIGFGDHVKDRSEIGIADRSDAVSYVLNMSSFGRRTGQQHDPIVEQTFDPVEDAFIAVGESLVLDDWKLLFQPSSPQLRLMGTFGPCPVLIAMMAQPTGIEDTDMPCTVIPR